MSRNPYIELYSFIGVGLGRKLSFLEISDLARFWPYDPSLRDYDPLLRGSLINRVIYATPVPAPP